MKSIVYFNGKFLPYEEACIPLATHALHYGTGCFEGIRGYWSVEKKKLSVFKLRQHYERLQKSCTRLLMKLPNNIDELCQITIEVLKRNNYSEDVYIRPLIYKSSEIITAFNLRKLDDGFAIYTTPLGRYLNASKGIKAITSSWQRVSEKMIPPWAKPTGLYLNTALAKTEAEDKGFDEAILLNTDGSVSEGSAENIFLVRGRKLITPSSTQNILLGITRATIIELAKKEFNIETEERKIDKKELFEADEMFVTGTGAEVTPLTQINGHKINGGNIGRVTKDLQTYYFSIVRAKNNKYSHWLTKV